MFENINWGIVLPIVVIVLIVLLVIAIFARLFRVAVVAVILAILVPITVTILCGEGEDYISKFSSLFAPEIEQSINDSYKDYSEKEKENPVISSEGFDKAVDDLWTSAKGSLKPAGDAIKDLWEQAKQ